MIRFGIVGCGNISGTHAEAVRRIQQAELIACCDNNENKGRLFAEKNKCIFFSSFQTMLKDAEIDAVIIATPHYLHGEMTKQAFAAGKHVLCEKPMAITVSEAESVIEMWQRQELMYAVCYQNRFNPSFLRLKEMIDMKCFGELKGIKCELTWHRGSDYYNVANWKGSWSEEGGGVLINQAIHTLDVVTWMVKLPNRLKGKIMTTLLEGIVEVEDAAMATAIIDDETPVVIYASNNYSSDPAPTVTFDFENANVVLTADRLLVDDRELPLAQSRKSQVAKNYWGSGHLRLIQAFVNQLEEVSDSEARYLAGADALESLKMVCGIYQSDREDRWITL